MKRKATGLAFIFVSGILAYLALAIMFWQSAWAGPLAGEKDIDAFSVGAVFEQWKQHDDWAGFASVYHAIDAAVSMHALQDCVIDGSVDYSCANDRRIQIRGYLARGAENVYGTATNKDLTRLFFDFAIKIEVDENTAVGVVAAVFVQSMVSVIEKKS